MLESFISVVDLRGCSIQRANYYQFLSGLYFDTSLEILADWRSPLRTLSISQDPIPEESKRGSFAQPLVFFSLSCISKLVSAHALSQLQTLRLSVPLRPISTHLLEGSSKRLSTWEVVDLSFTRSNIPSLIQLTTRFPNLRHIILDHTYIIRHDTNTPVPPTVEGGPIDHGVDALNQWMSLANSLAVAGLHRSRELEKVIKNAAEEAIKERQSTQGSTANVQDASRHKRGRKGLAAATISLRQASVMSFSSSADLHGNSFWKESSLMDFANNKKIRILPPATSLVSLCSTLSDAHRQGTSPHIDRHKDCAKFAFSKGWQDGIKTLRSVWQRLRVSHEGGLIRLFVFVDSLPKELRVKILESSLDRYVDGGLINMDRLKDLDVGGGKNWSWEWLLGDSGPLSRFPPILCLEGNSRTEQHTSGCGHEASTHFWSDIQT